MKKISLWIAAFAIAAAIAPRSAEAAGKTYTLFAGGDVNLGRWVPEAIQETGPKAAFEAISDMTKGADIALVNLECVVSTKGRFWHKGDRRPFLYRGRPEMLDVLTEAGIDVAVAANNHAMDYGPDALLEEIELLDAAGIVPVGIGKNYAEASRPVFVRVGELIVAFVGLETMYPAFGATAEKPGSFNGTLPGPALEALKGPIAEARAHADLVVFTPHWGDNWTDRPADDIKEVAHALIDLGVDAIIGHSSHQFHGIEVYKGRPIVYDIGSLFFDTVGQGRLKYSVGFVLEFDARGFSKITMYPLILRPNRTEYADGAEWEKIKTLMTSLSAEFDPKVPIAIDGKILTLRLEPPGSPHPRASDPDRVHVSGSTRTLPEPFRSRPSDAVLAAPPEWAADLPDVALDNGVVVLGGRSSDAVRPRTAFVAEVAMTVPGPLGGGRWVAAIKGVLRGGDARFTWSHPIADGAWIPALWQKGQIVLDRTLVRAEAKEEGVYDLFWRLENLTAHTNARPLDATLGDADGFIRIGEIEVKSRGIPSGPAGVAWDGWLPKNKKFDAERFERALAAERTWPPALIAAVIGGALLLLAAAILLVVRIRRRRSRRPR